MRIRKPLTETICPSCTHKFLCNDNEVAPDVVHCPRCGLERRIEYPPAFEEQMGCGPLIGSAGVLFAIATLTGGGGLFGILLGAVLGIGIPIGIAVLAYHALRGRDE